MATYKFRPELAALSAATFAGALGVVKYLSEPPDKEESTIPVSRKMSRSRAGTQQKPEMAAPDSAFLASLFRLLKILFPNVYCRQVRCALAMVALLMVRTMCDLHMIRLVVAVEMGIVSRKRTTFFGNLMRFLRFMVPVACITSLLKYTQVELSLQLRQRLTEYLQEKYLQVLQTGTNHDLFGRLLKSS
jgi:hypothetical protein